jgi:hypothetical protein
MEKGKSPVITIDKIKEEFNDNQQEMNVKIT